MALQLQRLGTGERDREVVLELLRAAPTYERRTLGRPTVMDDAIRLLSDGPPAGAADAKAVFVLVNGELAVGLLDLIRGWPSPDTAHIGLLLIREDHHRRGLGRAAALAVDDVIAGWSEITRLRATVLESNLEALSFWTAVGFRDTGERRSSNVGDRNQQARVITKVLSRGITTAAAP